MIWSVYVKRLWSQSGTLLIEAEKPEDAKVQALKALDDAGAPVKWEPSKAISKKPLDTTVVIHRVISAMPVNEPAPMEYTLP